MAASKETYRVTGTTIPEIVQSLNFILARIADRLDKIEGLRGTSTIRDGLTVEDDNQHVIHGFNTSNET